MTISETTACVFIGCSTLILATNGGFRKILVPNISCISFMFIYSVSRFIFAVIIWLAVGYPVLSTFNSNVLYNISLLILGGLTSILGNCLYFSCTRYISVSSTQASSSATQIIFGVSMDYLISSTDINLTYLIVGNVLSLVGLSLLIGADGLKPIVAPKPITENCSVEDDDDSPPIVDESSRLIESVGARDNVSVASTPTVFTDYANWVVWVARAAFGGVLFTGFSVFSDLESENTDAITDGSLINMFFHIGFLFATPLAIYLFYHLELLGDMGYKVESLQSFCKVLGETTPGDLIGASLIGFFTSAALVMFFYAISVLPDAVSYAVLCTQPVVATLSSICLFGDLSITPSIVASLIVFIALCVYVGSIYILFEYAYY